MDQNKHIIDVVALVFIQNNQILLTRTKGSLLWYLPGGKRISGESNIQTLVREINEELSVNLRLDTIQYLETIEVQAANQPIGHLVNMKCYSGTFDGEIRAGREIDETGFFGMSIIDKAAPAVKEILLKFNGKGIIS